MPKKQNKVTQERGNILKAFRFFTVTKKKKKKKEMLIRNEGNLIKCSALDNCNTNRMEAR